MTRTYYDALNRPFVVIRNFVGDINSNTPPTFDANQPDKNIGTKTYYDAAGRAYRAEDLTTGRSDWTCYDIQGRVTKNVTNATVGDPCGTGSHSGNPDQNLITEYRYDSNNRQIATIAPDGKGDADVLRRDGATDLLQ